MITELNQTTRVRDDGCVWVVERREHVGSAEWRSVMSSPHRREIAHQLNHDGVGIVAVLEWMIGVPAAHPAYREPRGTVGGVPNMMRQT
jgi:hypothetical protein